MILAFHRKSADVPTLSFILEQLGFLTVPMFEWRNLLHDYFPSDISEWRVSCSNTFTLNLQPSTESARVGLALRWITTWGGWKRTAILHAPSFAGCHHY